MDPIFIWLGGIVVLIIVGVKLLERRIDKGVQSRWTGLAAMIQGSATTSGATGSYQGIPIEAQTRQVSAMAAANPLVPGIVAADLGGWLYEVTGRRTGNTGQWTVAYDGKQSTADGISNDGAASFASIFAVAGPGKLTHNQQAGVVVYERFTPIKANMDIKDLGKEPVPTQAEFTAQLDLVAAASAG